MPVPTVVTFSREHTVLPSPHMLVVTSFTILSSASGMSKGRLEHMMPTPSMPASSFFRTSALVMGRWVLAALNAVTIPSGSELLSCT